MQYAGGTSPAAVPPVSDLTLPDQVTNAKPCVEAHATPLHVCRPAEYPVDSISAIHYLNGHLVDLVGECCLGKALNAYDAD